MARLMRAITLSGLTALCAGLFLTIPQRPAATSSQERAASVTFGEPQRMAQGTVRSWVATDTRGTPTALGVEIADTALAGLPQCHEEYAVPLPIGAAVPPFNHIGVDWNPQGHIPPHIYDVPHFDFHFHLMSQSQRARVTGSGADQARVYQTPDAAFMPPGYVMAPESSEPGMGAHWIDPASHEFHGRPFTHTLVYGFYGGRMSFIEPMVTLAFLRTRPDVTAPVVQPQAIQASGYYPIRYRVQFIPRRGASVYRVSLQGLALREASAGRPGAAANR